MFKDENNNKFDLEERTGNFGAMPNMKEEAKELWNEAKELNLIFNAIYNKVK